MRRYVALALLGVGFLAGEALSQFPPAPPLRGRPRAPAPGGQAGAQQLVDQWYQRFLNRQRDAWAAVWVDALRTGQPPEAVLSKILSSQEYYDKAGGTPEGFVQTLYIDLVGREPTPREVQFWASRLNQVDRDEVAYQVLTRHPGSWQGGVQESYAPAEEGYDPYPSRYDYRPPRYRYRR